MNKWLKITLLILFFALVSVSIFLILKACNIANIETLQSIIQNSKHSVLIFILIQVFILVFFCFVPILNTALIILGIILFGAPTAFISCIVAVFFSSTILFFIGDKFGEFLAEKFVGKKELEDIQNTLDRKSKFFLPVLFMIPAIPDEALCLVAGMTKIKYWYFILVSLVYHAIEIGLLCFCGSGLIDWSSLSVIEWILFINVAIIDFYFLIKIEKYLEKKKDS